MNKIYLLLCTLMLLIVGSTNVFSATSDSMTIEPSYKTNNKHAKNNHNNDFYDPNHVTNDRNNILTNPKDDLFNNTNTNQNQLNSNRVNNKQMNNYYSNDGNYYQRQVTPTTNTINTQNGNFRINYGMIGLLGLAAFLGFIAFLGFRNRERVD